MFTGVHHLDRSHRWSISSAAYVKNRFLFEQLFICYAYSVVFEDDNRAWRRIIIIMLPRYNKTIVARCDGGPWVLYTLGGKLLRLRCNFPPRGCNFPPRGCNFPPRCTKRHGPCHCVQQLYNVSNHWYSALMLFQGPNVIELLKQKILINNCLLSRNKQDTRHNFYW